MSKVQATPMPADFAALRPTMSQLALQMHYGACDKVIRRWCKEAGFYRVPATQRPMPADFAERFAELKHEALRAHYRAQAREIRRWQTEAGLVRIPQPTQLPDNIDALAADTTPTGLAKKMNCSVDTVRRLLRRDRPDLHARCTETARLVGLAKMREHAKSLRVNKVVARINQQAAPVTDAQQAMRYLQRFGPCYPRSVLLRALEGYSFRGIHMTAAQIEAEARKRGWNPDAWQQVAA